VSENNAAAKESHDSGKAAGGKPIILYALVVLNMLFVAGVGAMLYVSRKNDTNNAKTIDKAANGMAEATGEGGKEGKEGKEGKSKTEDDDEFIGKMIPMETFLVNLSGNRGNKVLKVNMELEVEGERIADEIDKRKPQIRDIIIILLSSKTYAQLSSTEGKEYLRDEIRDTVNSFLTKGKIKHVHFTEFIFN